MQIAERTIIDGRFRILKPLGAGAMGAVFEAEQVDLERVVAIKFLADSAMAEGEAFARFQREAQVLSQLLNKNIIQVYAFGKWQGMAYMVMERVHGKSLQALLQPNKPLESDFVLKLMHQACAGLEAAHKVGAVHRDLKPSNLLVTDDGELKIIDFGLAKILRQQTEAQQLTEAGSAVGSVLYMSPEQCTGDKIDVRSDIYALGCVMHHCLAGVPPFEGDHSVVVMIRHMNDLASRLPNPKLQPIVDNAMAKKPADRYQSAAAMQTDIEAAMRGEQIIANVGSAAAASLNSAPTKLNKRCGTLVAITLAIVGLIGLGAIYGIRQAQAPAVGRPELSDRPIIHYNRIQELGKQCFRATSDLERCELHIQMAEELQRLMRLEPTNAISLEEQIALHSIAAVNAADGTKQVMDVVKRLSAIVPAEERPKFANCLLGQASLMRVKHDNTQARRVIERVILPVVPNPSDETHTQSIIELLHQDLDTNDKNNIEHDTDLAMESLRAVTLQKAGDFLTLHSISEQLRSLGKEIEYAKFKEKIGKALVDFDPDKIRRPMADVVLSTVVPADTRGDRVLLEKLIKKGLRYSYAANYARGVTTATCFELNYGLADMPHDTEEARKWMQKQPDFPDKQKYVAQLTINLADWEEKHNHSEKAATILTSMKDLDDETDFDRYGVLASCYTRLHKPNEAWRCVEEQLRAVPKLDSNRPEFAVRAQMVAANVLVGLGRKEDAQPYVRRANEICRQPLVPIDLRNDVQSYIKRNGFTGI